MQIRTLKLVLKSLNGDLIQVTKEQLQVCFDVQNIKAEVVQVLYNKPYNIISINIFEAENLNINNTINMWFTINGIGYNGKDVAGKTPVTSLKVVDNPIDLDNSNIFIDIPYLFCNKSKPDKIIKGSLGVSKNIIYV